MGLASRIRRIQQPIVFVAWAVGLLVQVVLVFLVGQMIDLSLSLMELWVELAAKHLRIVLDPV
jgi:hypothetical protein